MKQKNIADNLQDLPKWAQSEINVLQMRLKEAKEELVRIYENPVSNTVLGYNSTLAGSPIKYLPNNQLITFIVGESHFYVRLKDTFLEINAQGIGDLYIHPVVSNSIQLHLK